MAEHKRQRRDVGGGGRGRRGGGRGDSGGSERQGFTAFNMEDENDEGHFDEAGNFIWDKEEKSVQEEAWLDTVSEDQIEAAKSAKDRKDYRDEQEDENLTEDQANETLASLLQPRETVLQALQRLGNKRSKARGSSNNKRKQSGDDSADPVQTAEEKEQFSRITEAADYLMRIGEVDVYSQMKEEFISEEELLAQRQQRVREQQEAKTEEAPPPANETMWEYKGADGAIHGPFTTSSFIAWRQQGYFVGDNAVDMRIVSKDKDAQGKDAEKKKQEAEENKPKVSAEEELMNDFEDSDDDDDETMSSKPAADSAAATSESEWKRSDQIDFEAYQT